MALGLSLVVLMPSSMAGATADEGEPTIHWRFDVVDVRADSMTLKVGDEMYTTAGVDVVVDAYNGDLTQWQLIPRWVEDGETFWLYFDFYSDGEHWTLDPWLWREGLVHPNDAAAYLEGLQPQSSNADFPDEGIRLPLGQPNVGDWRLDDRILVPTCDASAPNALDVSLTFDDLRLSVSPRQPTFLDTLAEAWFHIGSMLGDFVRGSLEPPKSRILECPETGSESS